MFFRIILFKIKQIYEKWRKEYNEEVMRLMQQKFSFSITPPVPYLPKYPTTRAEAIKRFQEETELFREKEKKTNKKRKQHKVSRYVVVNGD